MTSLRKEEEPQIAVDSPPQEPLVFPMGMRGGRDWHPPTLPTAVGGGLYESQDGIWLPAVVIERHRIPGLENLGKGVPYVIRKGNRRIIPIEGEYLYGLSAIGIKRDIIPRLEREAHLADFPGIRIRLTSITDLFPLSPRGLTGKIPLLGSEEWLDPIVVDQRQQDGSYGAPVYLDMTDRVNITSYEDRNNGRTFRLWMEVLQG